MQAKLESICTVELSRINNHATQTHVDKVHVTSTVYVALNSPGRSLGDCEFVSLRIGQGREAESVGGAVVFSLKSTRLMRKETAELFSYGGLQLDPHIHMCSSLIVIAFPTMLSICIRESFD